MSELTGKTVASTYKDLLHMGNSNSGIDATVRYIQDGEGHQSGVGVSTLKTFINSTDVEIEGDITTRGDIQPADDNTDDLGSASRQLKDVYMGGDLHMKHQTIMFVDPSNTSKKEQLTVDSGTRRLTYNMNDGGSQSIDAVVVQSYDAVDGAPNTKSAPPALSLKTLTTEVSACYSGPNPDEDANHVKLETGFLGQMKNVIGIVELGPVTIHSTDMIDCTKIKLPGGGGSGIAETTMNVSLQYTSNGWLLLSKSSDEILTS